VPALARSSAPYVLASASVALFLVGTLTHVGRPGLEYDETIFVKAALGGDYPDKSYVYREAFGVPTMIMPYIGALKAWLYAPIFAAFGVSVETIRVPAILISAASLGIAFVLARRLFGLWPAALLALLLATDTSFAIMSRADFGPVVLSAFLRVVALAAYFAFVRSRSPAALWALTGTLALGLFNKLDFGLFAVALAVAALAVDRRTFARAIADRPAAVLLPIGAFVAWFAFVGVVLIRPARRLTLPGTEMGLLEHARHTADLVAVTASGAGPYEWMTASHSRWTELLSWAVVAATAFVVATHVGAWLDRREPRDADAAHAAAFCAVLLAVLTLELAFTKQVSGGQHILLVWPLPALLAVALLRAGRSVFGLPTAVPLVVFAVLAVGTHAVYGAAYTRALTQDARWTAAWSPEVYRVADVVNDDDGRLDGIYTADWGIAPVFALVGDADRRRFLDLWPNFQALNGAPERDIDGFASYWFARRRVLVLTHTQRAEVMRGANRSLREIFESIPSARVRAVFRGRDFVVWRVAQRS
jgi:hypothetical protein